MTQQSAAVGIDADGIIVLRKNGGLQGEGKWTEWLDTLGGPRTSAELEAPSTAAQAAPAPVEAVPTQAPAPSQPSPTAAPAPTTAPPPAATAAPAPTTGPAPTAAPPPTAIPAPTQAPPPPPTATPRPRPTSTPTPAPTATPNIPVGHNIGQRAPDFTVTAVSGETITLSEVTATGKPVLIYFFATW